ncbi:MAG: hypothetical protein IPI42_06620 [Saprospiraceae bacterium]|nr:hypothetical protein [Candidatus Parvibacillus calidus]
MLRSRGIACLHLPARANIGYEVATIAPPILSTNRRPDKRGFNLLPAIQYRHTRIRNSYIHQVFSTEPIKFCGRKDTDYYRRNIGLSAWWNSPVCNFLTYLPTDSAFTLL